MNLRRAMEIHPKVAGGTLGGAVSLIFLWGLSFVVAVPPEVAAAFTLVIMFICGWLVPAPKVGDS